ncbi:MAG: hypothetical protein QOK05_2473 [Chloroflexota bacterium]|jgi:hypothetical protein|nr:hypothetical protein [Chloroflexota bacterium]
MNMVVSGAGATTRLSIMAILGIQDRWWALLAVAIVVLVVLAVVMSRRSRGPKVELRDLANEDVERYQAEFESIEREFVDRPEQAAARARGLVEELVRRRGFPDRIEPAQRVKDIARHDREAARSLETAHDELKGAGNDTERLRRAVQHYRYVFYRLTGTKPPGA